MSPGVLIADFWSKLLTLIQKKMSIVNCKCVISLSNMGEKALHSHPDGKKQEKVKIINRSKISFSREEQ